MKKKAIEKIPFLGLKELSKNKAVRYVGVTAVKIISHEKHLFLEVYRNEEGAQKIPKVRIVLTKKDFGTYFPDQAEWSRQKIEVDKYSCDHRLIWQSTEEGRRTWEQTKEENVLQNEKDRERLEKFCKRFAVWDKDRWWEYVCNHQDAIVFETKRRIENRKYKRRQDALNDRIAHTRQLPEKKILKLADQIYFREKHYLYYKKHGSWVQIACSKCGGVTDARWKSGISYESQFQRHVEEPREGYTGVCPMCGAYGEYKCQGKTKGSHSKRMYLFLGQKYKEKGMVLRYIEVSKEWRLGLIEREKGEEMYNASEELSGIEIARAYFEPDKDCQIDYHKRCTYGGGEYWDDCNLYGHANITIGEAPILLDTYDEMKETMFQYSALREYAGQKRKVNPIRYFERYQQIPQIEMLSKMGLIGVVDKMVNYHQDQVIANAGAKRPDEFLGIYKGRVKQLKESKGDMSLLGVMRMEKRLQKNWTADQLEHLAEVDLDQGAMELALKYMSLQKLLNRVGKYAGCEYGTGCQSATERLKQSALTYIDYLSMRETLGYDLSNTVYQQPKCLGAAHAKMVAESTKEEVDERIREVKVKFPDIRSKYRSLRKKYFYEDEEYLIRPARSAEEIVTEGRILHHCVGGNNYLKKHNNGDTYILMVRFRSEPEVPYITVEIEGNEPKIIQWYGNNDKKPNQKAMQEWLDNYLLMLKTGTLTKQPEAAIA